MIKRLHDYVVECDADDCKSHSMIKAICESHAATIFEKAERWKIKMEQEERNPMRKIYKSICPICVASGVRLWGEDGDE